MNKTGTDPAPAPLENGHWTLIRGARQLLTLQGASGPRRGSAMSDLNMISDGAVLIRDGVIEELGPTRRVENLAPARSAREIDATGKVVMPAFVDPDAAIAAPGYGRRWDGDHSEGERGEPDIRRMSRRRLESQAALTASDLARYGVLTIGAHTLSAPDLQNTLKALRLQRTMQSKPLRIRSVFSPPCDLGSAGSDHIRRVCETWMPTVFRKKLASLLEIPVTSEQIQDARALASAAAAAGFNIRFRISGPLTTEVLELAYAAGAIAMLGLTPGKTQTARALADVGCVNVVLAARILADEHQSERSAIDDGVPVALASGYRRTGTASMNPQFLLHVACRTLGMTIEEAIVGATYNAAYSLRLSRVTGSLEKGKSADICVMDVDHYRELARRAGHHDVWLAMRSGKVIYRRPGLISD